MTDLKCTHSDLPFTKLLGLTLGDKVGEEEELALPHSRAEQKAAENPGPLPTRLEEAGAMGRLPAATAVVEGPGFPRIDSQTCWRPPLSEDTQGTLPSATAISHGPKSVTDKVLVA